MFIGSSILLQQGWFKFGFMSVRFEKRLPGMIYTFPRIPQDNRREKACGVIARVLPVVSFVVNVPSLRHWAYRYRLNRWRTATMLMGVIPAVTQRYQHPVVENLCDHPT